MNVMGRVVVRALTAMVVDDLHHVRLLDPIHCLAHLVVVHHDNARAGSPG